jgi:hypothetical protein
MERENKLFSSYPSSWFKMWGCFDYFSGFPDDGGGGGKCAD